MEKKYPIEYNTGVPESRIRAEQFFDEEFSKLIDIARRHEVSMEKETWIGCYMAGYKAAAHQGAVWVKADQKPEYNVGVLVFIPGEDNHITSGMWDISNEWVLLDEYRTPDEEVTHWMALPAIPEGYTDNEIPSELIDVLKKIAEEELPKLKAATPSNEGDAVEWISISDQLPEIAEYVMVYNTERATLIGRLMSNGWVAMFADGEKFMGELTATHWRPLPEPPKNTP